MLHAHGAEGGGGDQGQAGVEERVRVDVAVLHAGHGHVGERAVALDLAHDLDQTLVVEVQLRAPLGAQEGRKELVEVQELNGVLVRQALGDERLPDGAPQVGAAVRLRVGVDEGEARVDHRGVDDAHAHRAGEHGGLAVGVVCGAPGEGDLEHILGVVVGLLEDAHEVA